MDGSDDLRPIAHTGSSFSDTHQRWPATEKEAFAVYQSFLKLDLYLRGVECILHFDHKTLEPFLSKGMEIPKLDQLTVGFADYDIICVHIKGSNSILADDKNIKTLNMHNNLIENWKMLKVTYNNPLQK